MTICYTAGKMTSSGWYQARDVCLFIGKSPGITPHLGCKVDDITDIDSRQVSDGCVLLRIATPPVLVMIYNTRALLLEDFVRLLRKLTERRKVGNVVRLRYTPEQVLESQRIEREQAAAVTNLHLLNEVRSTSVPKSVANLLGDLCLSNSGGHTSPARASFQGNAHPAQNSVRMSSEPLKAALDVLFPFSVLQHPTFAFVVSLE